MSRGIKLAIHIVTWVLIGIVLCLAILLAGLRLFGYDIYTVLSGSMEPDIKTGSLVYVKDVPTALLEEGDTITFMKTKDTVVTHRIKTIEENKNITWFHTYGINNYDRDENGDPILDENNNIVYEYDATPVHEDNVIGKAEFSVPYVGYLANFISKAPGIYVAVAFCVLLLLLVFLPDILFPASKNDDGKKDKKDKKDDSDKKEDDAKKEDEGSSTDLPEDKSGDEEPQIV